MHELAVCESLLAQVRQIAAQRGAGSVGCITLRIGPLSGVEPDLLRHAFEIARAGAYTPESWLEIERVEVELRCRDCGAESGAAPNRMLCSDCGSWQVDLIRGDEMLLASVELRMSAETASEPTEPARGDAFDV